MMISLGSDNREGNWLPVNLQTGVNARPVQPGRGRPLESVWTEKESLDVRWWRSGGPAFSRREKTQARKKAFDFSKAFLLYGAGTRSEAWMVWGPISLARSYFNYIKGTRLMEIVISGSRKWTRWWRDS
ncbi:MAG: hypothetical protein AAGC84_01050 [Pseudomonas sp.]